MAWLLFYLTTQQTQVLNKHMQKEKIYIDYMLQNLLFWN